MIALVSIFTVSIIIGFGFVIHVINITLILLLLLLLLLLISLLLLLVPSLLASLTVLIYLQLPADVSFTQPELRASETVLGSPLNELNGLIPNPAKIKLYKFVRRGFKILQQLYLA